MTRQALDKNSFNTGLLDFIAASPTPFHAVSQMSQTLLAAGFQPLEEVDAWELQAGGRYFVTRNGSSIIAFSLPSASPSRDAASSGISLGATPGIRLAGAHTDSPCLRIKPQPDLRKNNYLQLGVEVYGGALLNPWFDRDLSIAGRVDFITHDQQLKSCLIDMKKPVAVIPSLAIHMDREANQLKSVNAQKDLPPLLSISGVRDSSFDELLLRWLQERSRSPHLSKLRFSQPCLLPGALSLHAAFDSARLPCSRGQRPALMLLMAQSPSTRKAIPWSKPDFRQAT